MRGVFLTLLLGLTCSSAALAQPGAAEHKSHHPDAAAGALQQARYGIAQIDSGVAAHRLIRKFLLTVLLAR